MVLRSNRFDSSQCEHRITVSFDRSHPTSDVLLCLHRDVRLHLLTQALIITDAEAEIPQTHEEPVQDSHVKSSAFTSKKRAMIAAVCSQSRFSVWSSFSPARVSR